MYKIFYYKKICFRKNDGYVRKVFWKKKKRDKRGLNWKSYDNYIIYIGTTFFVRCPIF